MAKRKDNPAPNNRQITTVTLEQEEQLRQTFQKLGIAPPPLEETSTEESVHRLRDFEQEGGE